MAKRLRAPESADRQGVALWRAVTSAYDLSPTEAETLRQAVRVVDVLARLDVTLMDEELVVEGYNGQPRPHPLLTVASDQRRLLAELFRNLSLPMPDEDTGRVRSPAAVASAQARWRKERGRGDVA